MKQPVNVISNESYDMETPETTISNLDVLEKWLDEMSETQRMVVSLHYMQGLTAKEITSIIPMKRRAVSTMLWRAKQKLKGMMYDK